MMKTAKLLLHCPDKPGILAEVTDFITVNKGNIIYLDQYVDHVENIFFMRIEWELKNFLIPQEKIEDYFATLYAQKYEMFFRLYFSDTKPRMAIFVSKMSHCLFDLLARYTAGEWNVEIPLIISNHPDLQHVAERFGIPFYLFPITKETKEEQEKKEMELLAKHKVNFIVLARYMQVILNELSLIFQEILKRDNIVLASETTSQDVEGWNSLTNMLLISRIEKDFNVHFTFRDIVRFKNVGDICNAILTKTK